MLDVVGGAEPCNFNGLRGGEVAFVGRLVLRDGEEFKDAATGVVEEEDGQAAL